jgi:predicted ribosome quality control (RQC) complex YloA/Tae2 family protein
VREPFHRVPLGHGYEAWVGRSAADNDALTLRHARPFDLWLHARGVTGSHVVVRLPSRTATVPRPVVERAAEVAAYYSKARPSTLVPVTVTPRKYVRKRRGSPPGAVVVEREEVLIVPPRGADDDRT